MRLFRLEKQFATTRRLALLGRPIGTGALPCDAELAPFSPESLPGTLEGLVASPTSPRPVP